MGKCLPLLHHWESKKRSGNYDHKECTKCSKRAVSVIDNLPFPFGGMVEERWLEGGEFISMDEKAMRYPKNEKIKQYMWNKNK